MIDLSLPSDWNHSLNFYQLRKVFLSIFMSRPLLVSTEFWTTGKLIDGWFLIFPFQKKLKSGLLVTTASITVFSVASVYYEKQKFYEKYLVPFTHKLDPELAHKLTIFWFKTGLVPRSEYVDTPLLVGHNILLRALLHLGEKLIIKTSTLNFLGTTNKAFVI